MLTRLRNTLDRFEACSPREKALIGLTVAVALVMVLQLALIDPLTQRHTQIRTQIRVATNMTQGLESQLRNGPSVKNLAEQHQLEAEIGVVEEQLRVLDSAVAQYAVSLISPKEMPALLQTLLAEESLQLVAINNLPPVPS